MRLQVSLSLVVGIVQIVLLLAFIVLMLQYRRLFKIQASINEEILKWQQAHTSNHVVENAEWMSIVEDQE